MLIQKSIPVAWPPVWHGLHVPGSQDPRGDEFFSESPRNKKHGETIQLVFICMNRYNLYNFKLVSHPFCNTWRNIYKLYMYIMSCKYIYIYILKVLVLFMEWMVSPSKSDVAYD